MAAHNTLGEAGEEAACEYLISQGYRIIERNWHKNHLELDIIAQINDDELVIVEVKTRADTQYIDPQDAVNWKKVKHIVVATDAYLKMNQIDLGVRFDIITVVGTPGKFKIEHIIEAFYPPLN